LRKARIVEDIVTSEEIFHSFEVPLGEGLLEPPADQDLLVFGHGFLPFASTAELLLDRGQFYLEGKVRGRVYVYAAKKVGKVEDFERAGMRTGKLQREDWRLVCRVYATPEGLMGSPTAQMLKAALLTREQ
jgi:hypothetical protein